MALADIISTGMADSGLDDDTQEELEQKLWDAIRREYASGYVYVPVRNRVDSRSVRLMWNGRNVQQVMVRFGISRARVYQIINSH